jgi:Transposase zinc-binding domain
MVEAVYKPRKPKASPLYQSISEHFSEFESVCEERYQNKFGVLRDVVREVVYKYLGCGDLRKGFARIKCKDCKHEVLLAFSCKGRYFCPSCHQKRVGVKTIDDATWSVVGVCTTYLRNGTG